MGSDEDLLLAADEGWLGSAHETYQVCHKRAPEPKPCDPAVVARFSEGFRAGYLALQHQRRQECQGREVIGVLGAMSVQKKTQEETWEATRKEEESVTGHGPGP